MRAWALKDYPIQSFDKLRYRDTDRQGHVNNAVFSTFLETGRTELFYSEHQPLADPNASFVMARLVLDFRAEVLWPGEVWIGTGILAIGRSSVRMEQVIFQNARPVASAETVVVQVDNVTRRSTPLSPQTVTLLTGYLISPAEASNEP